MKHFNSIILSISLFFSGCSVAIADYFYQPLEQNESGMTAQTYHEVRAYFMKAYNADVKTQLGRILLVQDQWESPYFLAYSELNPHFAAITVSGGIARTAHGSPALLATILCHELGHLLGGAPYQTIPHAEWASSEGTADHYAASKCLPKVYFDQPQWFSEVTLSRAECGDSLECSFIYNMGMSFLVFLQRYSYRPNVPVQFELWEDPTDQTHLNSYPSDQCRLDIFKQSGQCLRDSTKCNYISCWYVEN
ncbi:MAG: hypothetical protein ACLGGX_06880 [Bdellovibrionia bacterium]